MLAMFSFHKNNPLTSSNQSSVDSLTTIQSTATSVSDVGAPQTSEMFSYGDLVSASGKRHSVFTLRSRSNTSTSTVSNLAFPSPTSMPGYDTGSSRSLFKGKKSKRSSGSFSSHSHPHDHEESQMTTRRTSILRKSKKSSERSESSVQNLKNRISSPFDFQHLTHTNRHHFAALQEASENELVAGFRAVRASQTPQRDLTGIKAEDLHSSNSSTDDVTVPARRSISAMELRPPPEFIDHVVDAQEPAQSGGISTRPSLRQSRSVESFSRPGVNPHMHRHTQSANPPPRMSSRLPAAGNDNPPDTASTRANRQPSAWDNVAPLSPTRMGGLLSSTAEERDYVGHALTTPDDLAIHPISPAFSPGLEDVAEEPERFASPRSTPLPPNMSPKSSLSPSQASSSFSQRSPVGRSHARKDSHVLPKQLNTQNIMYPMSQMSETLASPGLTRKHSIRKPFGARRKSNTWRVIEESWEDDIDYIYDNALEAECELDWESPSGEGKWKDRSIPEHRIHQRTSALTLSSSPVSSPGLFTGNFRSSLLVPNTSNVPELEPRSAISTSTVDTRVYTPSDYFNPHDFPHTAFAEADNFSFAPSLVGSQDFKKHLPREEMYDNLLADYEGLDKHFPLFEPTRSVASSTSSSHVRTSKRSSYDSSLMSSGHGSGSWTTAVRRSGSSAGSLPELVHSYRNTRQDFSMVVDNLAEEVGLFLTQDDNDVEDNDATPPGHTSQKQTFFASYDEQESTDSGKATLDAEMNTTLELARQGSTGSSARARTNHKYASSEGAAKLLALNKTSADGRTANSRSRAGSVPQKSRGPYLSLFPAPPKRSAVITPISPLSPMTN